MRGLRRPSGWTVLVPVVALAAGLLFATSGRTAEGTDLRGGEVLALSGLIRQRNESITRQEQELADLQTQVQRLTQQAGSRDGAVGAAQARGDAGMLSAGLVGLSGPGVEITLDDAPTRADGVRPAGAMPDDLVIHQSDVQAVVNALWASGADGVAIMGKRLVATSAVRCVGNVLLLQGRTYSPPFVVTAIGSGAAARSQLAASREVGILRQAVDAYGLTFRVRDRATVTLPAYDGPLDMSYATPR